MIENEANNFDLYKWYYINCFGIGDILDNEGIVAKFYLNKAEYYLLGMFNNKYKTLDNSSYEKCKKEFKNNTLEAIKIMKEL